MSSLMSATKKTDLMRRFNTASEPTSFRRILTPIVQSRPSSVNRHTALPLKLPRISRLSR
jgi:hypothetical protein